MRNEVKGHFHVQEHTSHVTLNWNQLQHELMKNNQVIYFVVLIQEAE